MVEGVPDAPQIQQRGQKQQRDLRKQWKIDRMPYYLLINRKGQIVDFGTTARPSNPQLVSRIEDALK